MKKRIVFELAAGILILVSALYTYVPKSQYMYELYDEEMIMKKNKIDSHSGQHSTGRYQRGMGTFDIGGI